LLRNLSRLVLLVVSVVLETGLTDALPSPLIHMLILVRNPDPFLNPPTAVKIPVPVVFPVAMVSVPAMNLAPMLVVIAISVPSDRNF
jgi:hypothetical protein